MAKGDPITVSAPDSIDAFGPCANAFGWPHTDLLLTEDGDVSRLVNHVLNQQKDDFIGIKEVVVDADLDPVHLFGVLTRMASTGIGDMATFDVHHVHTSDETWDVNLKMIGCHFVMTMEGDQAKLTGEIRTAKNQGPTRSVAAWLTATSYSAGRIVANGGALYRCLVLHTSGSSTEPGVGASWHDKWEVV
jgi:hypothetical protein